MSELMIAANTAAPAPAKPVTAAPAAPAPAKPVVAAPAAGKTAAVAPAPAKTATAASGKTQVPPPAPQSGTEQPQGSPWLSMLPFILIFVVMIFFMNRSQKKQMQKRQEMLDKIARGTKVLLTSGIYGTVDAVNADSLVVEIANGVKIKVAKSGIAGIDNPAESGNPEVK